MSRNGKLYFCNLLESGAVDPVKELYPFIDDYVWAFAQQYQHITIGGVQYPFQDLPKTTPVTANGDPVGAVVGLRGTPDAVQPVSADRPVWGATGLTLNGSQRLVTPSSFNFVQNTATFTIIIVSKLDNFANSREWWLDTKVATTANPGWGVYYDNRVVVGSPGRFRFTTGDGLNFTGYDWDGVIVDNNRHVYIITSDGSTCTLWVDGISQGGKAISPIVGTATSPLFIGSASNSAAGLTGTFETIFISDSFIGAAGAAAITGDLL